MAWVLVAAMGVSRGSGDARLTDTRLLLRETAVAS